MYKHMKWRRMEDPLGVTHLETYDWRRLGLVISHLWAWTFALVHAIQWQRHERKAHQRQGSLDMHGMHPHHWWCGHKRPWRRRCRHALGKQGRKKKNEHACIHALMLQFALFHSRRVSAQQTVLICLACEGTRSSCKFNVQLLFSGRGGGKYKDHGLSCIECIMHMHSMNAKPS